ncbi:MAG: Gfo/Idh/MocA family oxidoreductase [Spirochaetales bacterium]|nr:Gfo/Idh/MocA family oxidoreductase [Spirochaetales bacterium]
MNIGIMATGGIAKKMADTINLMDEVTLYAVASRSLEKANAFATEYGAEKAYGSYDELLSDSKVDLVYIATPHHTHKDLMLECINKGKNILCEKAFTINKKEAEEVFVAAKAKGVLVAEAIWTRYMPSLYLIKSLMTKIGTITSISANLGYKISQVERINDPKMGGGALLDLGVYPINFALMVHPEILSGISGLCVKAESGVDIKDSISLRFSDGVMATLFTDATTTTNRRGYIYGTEGFIEVENINCPEEIRLYDSSRVPQLLETYKITVKTGYEFELLSCKKAIEEGLLECPEMPHAETLRVMSLLDALRHAWNVKLAEEA